jgi:hypothetical protein
VIAAPIALVAGLAILYALFVSAKWLAMTIRKLVRRSRRRRRAVDLDSDY